jgi:hypothetical protein
VHCFLEIGALDTTVPGIDARLTDAILRLAVTGAMFIRRTATRVPVRCTRQVQLTAVGGGHVQVDHLTGAPEVA